MAWAIIATIIGLDFGQNMAFPALAKNGTQMNADNADLTGFMRSTYSVSENQRESASKMAFLCLP